MATARTTSKTTPVKKVKRPSTVYIFRCRDAGVHAGELISKTTEDIVIGNSRRLWRWTSTATLSELSQTGPQAGENKYGCVTLRIILRRSDVCEIIECSPVAATAIAGVPPWVAK